MHIPLLFPCIFISLASAVSPSDTLVNTSVWDSILHVNLLGMPRPDNVFTSVHGHAVLIAEIERVEERIASHKTKEMEIAKKYGIRENADSATILQTVKDMAWSLAVDSQHSLDEIVQDAEVLDALYNLRCRQEHLRGLRLPLPKLPNSSEQPPAVSEPSRMLDPDRSWGVIIGIDVYQTSPSLRGCVSDARGIHQYLVHDLGVPESHIQLLLAPHSSRSPDTPFPSRANIIKSLHSIHKNPLIQKDDNLILYFSGHGASYRCSDYFPKRSGGTAHIGAIEAICPADRYANDANGHPIPDISDRELNTILHLIRVGKGENITVITDCCYASGTTRGISSSLLCGIRNLPPSLASGLELMLRAGDESLKEYDLSGAVSVLAEDWSPLKASHVLLAACTEYQFAREVENDDGTVNGIFTEALITALRSGPRDLSYYDLCWTISTITATTTPSQTPTAIGENKKKLFPWYPRV